MRPTMTQRRSNYFTPAELLRRLQEGRWPPELDGRTWHGVRATLIALAARCSDAGGWTGTAWQISQGSGYGERWTRHALHVLEALGLLRWTRGGVRGTEVLPSHFSLSLAGLAEIIRWSKPAKDAAEAAQRTKTRARVAKILARYPKSKRRGVFPQVIPTGTECEPPPLQGKGLSESRPKPTPDRPASEPLTVVEHLAGVVGRPLEDLAVVVDPPEVPEPVPDPPRATWRDRIAALGGVAPPSRRPA